jgi:putative oxidoreductase
MGHDDRGLAFAARLLMAIIFLVAGAGKALGFAGTVAYFAKLGIPVPEVATVVSIVIELGGSILLLVGYRPVIVAAVMAVFTLVAALTAHQFWNVADPAMRSGQMNNFLKNVAMVGGFLMVIVDARRRRTA